MVKSIAYSLVAITLYLVIIYGFKCLFAFILLRDEFLDVNESYLGLTETIVYLFLLIVTLNFIKKKEPLNFKSGLAQLNLRNVCLVLLATIFYRVLEDPILRFNVINNLDTVPVFQSQFISVIDQSITFCNLVLLASTFEELFFRRIILEFFKKRSLKFGIVFSSFLFALIHVNEHYLDFPILITAFTFSIIASIIYLRYNVFYSILFHSTYNFLWYLLVLYKQNYWNSLAYLNFNYCYWLIICFSLIGLITLFYIPRKLKA